MNMSHDGLVLTPRDYAALLQRMTAAGATCADYCSQGGAVDAARARLLGKEAAVLTRTGTLANHLAVRVSSACPPPP